MVKRVKLIPRLEFDKIAEFSWAPIKLQGSAVPAFLRGIPDAVVHAVYASGTTAGGGVAYSDATIGTGQLIGGIDVYRKAPDDPVELNKDWYAVVVPPDDSPYYLISGPIRDDEHWLDDVPERLNGAKVFGAPRRHDDE